MNKQLAGAGSRSGEAEEGQECEERKEGEEGENGEERAGPQAAQASFFPFVSRPCVFKSACCLATNY